MPGLPAKPCSKCGALVRDGTSRCEQHKRPAWRQADDRRISRHARGYGSEWDKLRLVILKRDGYLCKCAECAAARRIRPATQVDHVISKANWLKLRGSLAGCDDPSNLAAIHAECHERKSLRDKGMKPRQAVGVDGWPKNNT